ncbi:MAG: glycoside hydrolase family 3 C-terminal domain-containing protein [Chitinispirillaceae bacterium]|nr:glycoside hydrolase family 3 C-terminal domain-containing protein [Chitinispirillaceae bacterium]
MKRTITILLLTLLALSPAEATKISNVKVDLIKGTVTGTQGDQIVRYYMGRLTYTFLAEDKDSIYVDFVIKNQATGDTITVLEKSGDVGMVKQRFAADTQKTVYFRAAIVGMPADAYVATVTANADMSKMWALADSLVGLMSYEQQQSTLYLSAPFFWFGAENFAIPGNTTIVGWRSSDGPHGVRWPIGPPNDIAIYGAGDPATLFPTEAAMGCSWDTSLVKSIGAVIARESRAMGLYCNLGPMCDLVINPRWGRAFETIGEDPYLNGKMVSRMVMGLQSEKVIATPKHFTPYLMETERQLLQVSVSERALRELFCVPFEMAICEGRARALMTCYNRVHVPGFSECSATWCERAASNRHTVEDIVRHDWGFDGVIMTDWDGAAVVDERYAYETDFDMSTPHGYGYTNIATNIRASIWTADPLRKKARNIMYNKLWAWGGKLIANDNEIKTHPQNTILSSSHLQLALEAARKTIVLAKNDPVDATPVLPLDKNGSFKIAVVGPYADVKRQGGGGSSAVTPDTIITPLQGIKTIVAGNASMSIVSDYTSADVAVVCVGVNSESEDLDRPDMTLPSSPVDQNGLVAQVMRTVKRTIVVYTGGSASIAGSWSNAPAVIIAFYPGRWQGQVIAEILFGDVNPSGHLSVTFPSNANDLPVYTLDNYEFKCTSVDTAHGYFFFEKTGKKPLFWFGHGLSYTTFKYNNIAVHGPSTIAANDRVDISVAVQNTGTCSGDDVVQLYVKPPAGSAVPRRVKDLRGFARVSLEPNEYKIVSFTLGPRDFSIYEPNDMTKTGAWNVIPGTYELIVGSTSDPAELVNGNGKCLTTTLTVQ